MRGKLLGWLLAAALLSAPAAQAGAIGIEPSNADLQVLTEELTRNFDPVTTPLLDPASFIGTPPGECAAGAPNVHALLIAGRDIPSTTITGPENDIGLLTAAFEARTNSAAQIVALTGDAVHRGPLRQAMLDTVERVACGDRVFLHFGGLSFTGNELLLSMADAVFDGDVNRVNAALKNGTGAERDAIAAIRDTSFLIGLNRNAQGRIELVDGADLSIFVTMVRNRGADIVVSLDSPFADRAAIADRQIAAGDSTLWSLVSADRVVRPALPLLPRHGEFFAIYGAVGNWASIDQKFTAEDGTTKTYGAFTFEFAKALQDPGAVTARLLGERIAAIPADKRARDGLYLVEGSDANMLLFERDRSSEVAEAAIHITSPEPTRGPNSVQSASIEIAGVVQWTSSPIAVLINGELADLPGDGTFTGQVGLKTGANTIKVVALMQDQRMLQKSLDIVFAGDVEALRGAGQRYAVIIGNSAYGRSTGFSPLSTPIADADALEALLTEEFGFVTNATLPDGTIADLSLRDASGRDTAMALYNVSQVAGENDTVLVYYAGHGIYEPLTTTAFWVPVDAVAGVPPTYLSASSISEAIARIQSRKVILISDSCFSGALLRGGGAEPDQIDKDSRVDTLLALSRSKSRLLISSGNNEPVTDAGGTGHSIFAQALLDGLAGMETDQFTARELFDGFILERVVANSKQEPQFRPLENVGHEGGDVIFVRNSS
jgi:hypothetical protein